MAAIENRYEFVYFFDVENGNPNGDPDAGNMPRVDPETRHGLVSDVCLKRKVRNYVGMAKGDEPPFEIYVKEKAVLNQQHDRAYKALGLKPEAKKLPKKEQDALNLTRWMCENYYDIRTFGAVMTTEVNCGQVRGPVQINFAKSIEPVFPMEHSITRMAVTNERDLEKERTMGRKFTLPYALYRAEGFVSPFFATDTKKGTGFSQDDLELLWSAMQMMFDHDRSAARGKMAARRLIVFRHDSALGNAPAHKLFDLVKCERATDDNSPAREFADYALTIDMAAVPTGVSVEEKI